MPRIQIALTDAGRSVDSDWIAADQDPAVMALAAHYLVTEGAFAAAGGPSATRGAVTSEKLGDASYTYARLGSGAAGAGSASEFASTVYGQTYLRLLRRNVAGVAIV